jgi:hypothetical protein
MSGVELLLAGVISVSSLASCGGANDDGPGPSSGGAQGSGGSQGTGGDLLSASPAAAVRMEVAPMAPQPPGTSCDNLGTIVVAKTPPTGVTAPGVTIRNGEQGASVYCLIRGSGTFDVAISVSDDENALDLDTTVKQGATSEVLPGGLYIGVFNAGRPNQFSPGARGQ